ncbi:MAG TPA: S8 family serine peptidase [Bacillus sp. (in: firmicutes)]|uniref:S8 family peptidase n=1 Tax=Bacillus litorisediminis TaxID=2922713 RepID=UPI001FAD8A83|nr:S8 family serine peptidase [Bacillus litorisediminis]HWO78362.1 S8 family serine peptidase [Bacillus sp. (in: firmicutes)]
MKRLVGLLFTIILLASCFTSSAFAVVPAGDGGAKNLRVLIVPKNSQNKANLQQEYGVRWDFGNKGFTTNVNENQLEALKNNKNLEVSLVDKIYLEKVSAEATRTATPSDQTPWGIQAIYADPTIGATSGGDNIRVAVLDTGAYTAHVDLTQNVEQCKDFSQNRSPIINGACEDKNGHGTHVAGTVLANGGADGQGVYGVAPNAKLWAYKVLGNSGFGYSDDIANAIKHAADEGNRLGVNVVISMSLGSSTKSDLIADAVTYAVNNGALVVAAAGNEGPNPGTIGYPGGLADAVAVAALENVQENGNYRVADFSSRGVSGGAGDYVIEEGDVEVSAPGRAIESTWKDGGYYTISGTSMATPHISGLAAKIWAENPHFSNLQLRSELQSRARANDVNGGLYAASGDDIASGFGFPLVQ